MVAQELNDGANAIVLDNLWDGLGAIAIDNPQIKHFFGKVTMYTSYNAEARDAVLHLMNYYFKDNDLLVVPKEPLQELSDISFFKRELEADLISRIFHGLPPNPSPR